MANVVDVDGIAQTLSLIGKDHRSGQQLAYRGVGPGPSERTVHDRRLQDDQFQVEPAMLTAGPIGSVSSRRRRSAVAVFK